MKMQQRLNRRDVPSAAGPGSTEVEEDETKCFGTASAVLSGPEAVDIHRENVQKLNSMTAEEISRARDELLGSVDGKLIEFLKSKRHGDGCRGNYDLRPKDSDRVRFRVDGGGEKTEKLLPPDVRELVDSGLNMDVVEEEKLGWTGDVVMDNSSGSRDVYAARFGLDGKLLPYVIVNKTTVDGLHHHGDEQHRPGYTVDELYSLLRRNHAPQRTLALDVLAKLVDNAGAYDAVLDKPLLCSLLDSGAFILFRMALDDTSAAIVTNALKALGNLFARKSDRKILAALSGCNCDVALPVYVVPDAEIDRNELDKSSDYDLVVLDLVQGALRTDLISRLQYVVFNMNVGLGSLVDVSDILTGIACRGEKYALAVVETDLYKHMFGLVFKNLRSNSLSESFVFLTRAISGQSVKCALKVLELNVLDSIFKYIHTPTRTPLLLECLHLWQTFFERKLAGQSIAEVANLVLKFVDRSVGLSASLTKTDLALMSASLSLIDSALRNFGRIYIDPVYRLTEIVLAKLLDGGPEPPDFETSKLIGNCFTVLGANDLKFDAVCAKAVAYLNEHFGKLCETLCEKSWLTCGYANNGPKCYPNLGYVNQTVVTGGDPLFMLIGIMRFMCKNPKRFDVPASFWTYLGKLMVSSADTSHWYGRYEIAFLLYAYEALTNNGHDRSSTHRIAITLLSLVPKCMARELGRTLDAYFDGDFADIRTGRDGGGNNNDFDVLKSFYELFVPGPKSTLGCSVLVTELEPVLSKDWLFLPIIKIHETDNFKSSEQGETLLKQTLANVLFAETRYPEICERTPLAARYCRVACTFMCGRRGTIFHEVKHVLNEIWHVYASQNDRLVFADPIIGIESFYDFYRTLCEHYASVSYSDPVFGAYVLLPLQRKHSVELRKLVWSELDLPETINVDGEHLDRVPLHNYTRPVETNEDLLKMYQRARVLRRKLIMYKIAVSHLNERAKTD